MLVWINYCWLETLPCYRVVLPQIALRVIIPVIMGEMLSEEDLKMKAGDQLNRRLGFDSETMDFAEWYSKPDNFEALEAMGWAMTNGVLRRLTVIDYLRQFINARMHVEQAKRREI